MLIEFNYVIIFCANHCFRNQFGISVDIKSFKIGHKEKYCEASFLPNGLNMKMDYFLVNLHEQ